MFQTLEDCPLCGKKSSAWPGHFCGACEEKYQFEEEQRRTESAAALELEVKQREAAYVAAGGHPHDFALYVKRDELGDPYIAKADM